MQLFLALFFFFSKKYLKYKVNTSKYEITVTHSRFLSKFQNVTKIFVEWKLSTAFAEFLTSLKDTYRS